MYCDSSVDDDPVWNLLGEVHASLGGNSPDDTYGGGKVTPSLSESKSSSTVAELPDVTERRLPNNPVVGRSRASSSSSVASERDIEAAPASFTKVFDKEVVSADLFFLPESAAPPNMTCEKIEGAEAWIWDNVLTEEECALLRQQSETAGYTYWDPSAGTRDDFRTAFTVETHHPALADFLWRRISNFLQPLHIDKDSPKHEVDIEGTWHPCGVNPTWLFARYIDGGHFSPHTDGNTVYDFNKRTLYTLLVYLNAAEDGATRVFDDAQMSEPFTQIDGKLRGNPQHVIASVHPRPGRVLCFYHRLLHEGNPAAEKYIIRTDVIFERRPALCTEPEDLEAFRLYVEAQELSEKGQCQEAMVLFRRAFRMSRALAKVYGQ